MKQKIMSIFDLHSLIIQDDSNMDDLFDDEKHSKDSQDRDIPKRSKKVLFTSNLEIEKLNLNKKIINYVKILLSDRCPHCQKFAGLLPKGGLRSLFTNDCVLRRVLLQEKWDVGKLRVDKNWVVNEMKDTLESQESGEASLQKIYTTKNAIEDHVSKLEKSFSSRIFNKLKFLKQIEEDGYNLLIERIVFFNVSVKTYQLYYTIEKYVPTIITPYTVSGEFAVSENISDDNLRNLLFYSSNYTAPKHEKYLSGGSVKWDSVMTKNVLKILKKK